MELIIRDALRSDVDKIKALSEKTFYETFAHQNKKEDMEQYISATFNAHQLISELEDDKNKFLLAVSGELPLGYAKLRMSEPPEQINNKKTIEMERIYVLKEFHDKKAGAALMNHCLDFAAKNKFEIIWLGVWEHNQKAIKFYERWGFQNFGSHIFMLGTDMQTDLLMKKELS